jgi:hypothetical protein
MKMMINSEVLRKKLNEKSLIDWIDNDNSSESYKQGFRGGIIKALAIISEVEYFEKHGHYRPPIELEMDEKTTEYLKIAMEDIGKKIKELDLESHSEKDIVEKCIELMEDVHSNMMEYMEIMGVQHTEGRPTLTYTYFKIVQKLLLSRTRHAGGTSTRLKCKQLGIESFEEFTIGESEVD